MQILILTILFNVFIFYRIDTNRLQAMVQMHSYLITNAKSELRFLDDNVTSEELDETFNQIALAMNNGNDLFDDYDINHIFEDDYMFNEVDEIANLEGINNNNLEISDFIDLSSSLFAHTTSTNFDNQHHEEESMINHGDLNFDIDELINSFELI